MRPALLVCLALILAGPPLAQRAHGQTVRLAVVQFDSRNDDFAGNLRRAEPLIRDAAVGGADLVLLPELAFTGYELSEALWQAAEPLDGPTTDALTRLSRTLGIYLGTSFLEVDGEHFYNTFVLATPTGTVAGQVRKQVPAGAEGYFFRGLVNDHVIDTPLGRIGVGICQENYRCFLPRHLHDEGAELLLMPYSYPDLSESSGLGSPPGRFTATWYATQLGIPAAASNKTGIWPQVPGAFFPGASAIADGDGRVQAELGSEPGLAVADVALDPSRRRAPDADCIGPYLSALTLGSWWDKRLTWLSVLFAEWFDADPDDDIARAYAASESRRAAALELSRQAGTRAAPAAEAPPAEAPPTENP